MKREHVAARLFKNRAEDGPPYHVRFNGSNLRQDDDIADTIEEETKTLDANLDSQSNPPQIDLAVKLHNVIQKASYLLGLNRKE